MKTKDGKHWIGKEVRVYNLAMDGGVIFEGFAVVKGYDERTIADQVFCKVLFDGDYDTVYRWITLSQLNK